MRYARVAAAVTAATAAILLGAAPPLVAAGAQPPGPASAPGPVTLISAGPGGGSEEVSVTWDAVADATGYRVLRSDTATGPTSLAAEFDVTTGAATAAAGVLAIQSTQHIYFPRGEPLEAPDESPQFYYTEFNPRPRCFQVIAFNAVGDAPPSAVACGAAVGVELEPATPVAAVPTFTG